MRALNNNTYNKHMQPDCFKLYALSAAADAWRSIYLAPSNQKMVAA